jgi:mevalonate kinase
MSGGSDVPSATGTGRAFGKVILFGEHAVVYGVPALAAGISKGVRATAQAAKDDELWLNDRRLEGDHELYQALRKLRGSLAVPAASLSLRVELPLGAGLGSSAAMAVASARALGELHRSTVSEREVFAAAQAWERVFHGNPSGIDVAAAQAMGLIAFSRGEEPQSAPFSGHLYLAVAQAGPPASTKTMVEGVARIQKRNPEQFSKTLEAISSLVHNARVLLRQGDQAAVGKLMDLNQMLLSGWMLSTEEIETACAVARHSGALGAKLTGAGGGGCVVALCANNHLQEKVLSAWESKNISCFSADVVGDGGQHHEHV